MTGAADLEVFLDDTPGETRGVIARGGRYTHFLIHRDEDPPQHRLGARSVGRAFMRTSPCRRTGATS